MKLRLLIATLFEVAGAGHGCDSVHHAVMTLEKQEGLCLAVIVDDKDFVLEGVVRVANCLLFGDERLYVLVCLELTVVNPDKRLAYRFHILIPVDDLLKVVLAQSLDQLRSGAPCAGDLLDQEVSELVIVGHLADFHQSDNVRAVLLPVKEEELIYSRERIQFEHESYDKLLQDPHASESQSAMV